MQDDPYISPEATSNAPGIVRSPLDYVVGTVGALLVFFAVCTGILLIAAEALPWIPFSAVGTVMMFVIALPLSILAAVSSFRATLRAAKEAVPVRAVRPEC